MTSSLPTHPDDSLYNSKLIRLLKVFSVRELHELEQCVSIPFLQTGKHIDQLLHYISSTDPDFSQKNMSRIAAFFFIFPDQKEYRAQQLNKVMASLLLAAEQYISIKALKKDNLIKQKLLIRNIQSRLPYKQVKKKIHRAKSSLNKNGFQDADFYIESKTFDTALYYHPEFDKFTNEANALMQSINNDLDRFYCLTKLKHSSELLTRNKIIGEKNSIYALQKIIDFAKKQPDPIFHIYGHMASMLSGNNQEESFKKLWSSFTQNLHAIVLTDQINILQIMINQVNRWYKTGIKKYLNTLLELYLFGLEKRIFFINNQITDATFTNAIITASILKKGKIAQQIEVDYQHHLKPAIKKNAVALTRAFRFFHAQQFEEAHQELVAVQFSDIGYKLRARSLLIRCYYESYLTGNQQSRIAIENIYKPLQKFIYKNPHLSPNTQKAYNLLFSSILKLTKAAQYNQEKKRHTCAKLRRTIGNNPIVAKEWLLQKIEHLEK